MTVYVRFYMLVDIMDDFIYVSALDNVAGRKY